MIYNSEKKDMVGCNYGGRYSSVGGGGAGIGLICDFTNVWWRLRNNMLVAPK